MPYPSKAQHGEHKQKTNMQEQEHFVKESQKEQIDKSNNLSTNTQLLKHLLGLKPKTKMFQLCFSRKRENPCKLLIYKGLSSSFRTQTRGRTGMEVNPLVFETSASTDSAIWACLISQMRCKDTAFF